MTRQEHAREAGRAVWHGLHAALLLLVAVLATSVDDLSTGRTVAVLALLAGAVPAATAAAIVARTGPSIALPAWL